MKHWINPVPSLVRMTLAVALLALGLIACSAPTVNTYANEKPVLDLRQYLNGPLTAHGLFTDRSGKVVKRFSVKMKGSWEGDKGLLEEDFSYSDGSTQRRVWRLQRQSDGTYIGMADDVVGQALGSAAGNAFNWHYTLALPVDGSVWNVQLDDWMYLMDAHTMLNKATMRKWGIRLGEVTLSFTKD